MNKEVVMVRLSDIIPNRFQPRLAFDEEALNELASSIKEHGIIQPLILRDLGNKYEIIAGERRYKAATIAGLAEVPAIVGSMDDQTSAELALVENIQRKDLSAIEEAKSYQKILELGNLTQDELAKRMGKTQSTIANKMRLLSLTNEVQVALMNNLISERHARCLLQIKDEDKQKEVLNKVMNERMNVRATDEYIKNILGIAKEIREEEEMKMNINEAMTPSSNLVESPKEVKEENLKPEVPIQENSAPLPEFRAPKEEPAIQEPTTLSVETPTDLPSVPEPNLDKVEMPKEESPLKEDPLAKLKVATAIKLAKDAVDKIKEVGYDVAVEETDNSNNYQIIIKIQK